jgi:hypothetical protein
LAPDRISYIATFPPGRRTLGEHSADRAEFFGEIDSGDLASEVVGKRPCRAADPASDIDHMHPGREPGRLGHAKRMPSAFKVKLLYGGERIKGQVVDVNAFVFERPENPGSQSPIAVD